ncbi:lycopene cyclase domain-containing protein [Jatrophihabitans telluris]|uniref:Lycopene cyclase domain-containing protein n=1 Tax=Jatrophihabitans telluris TaxID=2038343 RepID=A0ABY4QUX2_9ACTN|nr:lycopene cyclase domain-containing protein [Jatrophihabitans telluris]UQX87218.1 lycopene cyclase domain-containing protein [Jatrophihabitans telluris]
MSYTVLVVLALAGAVTVDLAVLRTALVRRRAFWFSYGICLVFQLLVNGVLTGIPVVRYSAADILGLRIAYAPVEDIGFGFALILLTLACWVALGRRRNGGSPRRGR